MIDFPVSITLFGHSIWVHPILETIGIFSGMRYYAFLKSRQVDKYPFTTSLAILIGATLGALIGSKLIGNLENPYPFLQGNISFKEFWSSNTIVGGLAFGVIGVEWAKKIIKHPQSTGDLITFPLILAMIIGRIGCFLTGVYEETYGLPTKFIFGMHLGDAYLRHPVALYEIAFLLILWVLLRYVKRDYIFPSGFIFQLFMMSYFIFRFLLDFIKPKVDIIAGLGTIQIVCLGVIIYYIYKIQKTISGVKKKEALKFTI